jgi:hypothetical protein
MATKEIIDDVQQGLPFPEAAGFQVAERLAVCRSLVRQLDALALLDQAAVQTDKDVAA